MRRLGLAGAVAIVATVLGIAVGGCGGDAPADTLVLYSGEHPQLTTALVQAFTRATHIKVNVRTADGIVLADQILQEGGSSPADVYLTENSPELMNLEANNRLAKLPAGILGQVPAREQSPDGKWVGIALRISSLAYDPARVSTSQLPRSVLDLAQPSWKGRIAVSPTDSDFPPVVGAIIATYGRSAAAQWLAGLKRNAQIFQDEEAVVAAVNRGDVAAGLVNQYYWYRLRLEQGAAHTKSRLYYFGGKDPGSVVNISGAGMLASSKHQDAAEKFLAFMVSPAGQQIISKGDDFEYPVRSGVAPNAALPPLADVPHTSFSVVRLGDDRQAAGLIASAGFGS
jgi:iron(III) transport system substrate-binding protein